MGKENGQFKKGSTPWNKDKKGIHLSPDTEFKKGDGNSGDNHPSWMGGVQINTNDCIYIYQGINQRARRPRLVYEKAFGPIPKGCVIIHLDGDKMNDKIENLKCITRAELMKLNSNRRLI